MPGSSPCPVDHMMIYLIIVADVMGIEIRLSLSWLANSDPPMKEDKHRVCLLHVVIIFNRIDYISIFTDAERFNIYIYIYI